MKRQGAGAGSGTQAVGGKTRGLAAEYLESIAVNDPQVLATGVIRVGNTEVRIPDFHNPRVPVIRDGAPPSDEDERNLEVATAMVNDNPQNQFNGTAIGRGVGFVHTVAGMQQQVRGELENVTNHEEYVRASKVYAAQLMLGNLGAQGMRQLMKDGGGAWKRAFKATYNVMFPRGGEATHEQVKKAQRAYAHLVATTGAENVTPEDMEATGLVAGEALAQHAREGQAVQTQEELQQRLQKPITEQGAGALGFIAREFVDHANERGAARGEAAGEYGGARPAESDPRVRAGGGAGGMGSTAVGDVPSQENLREARAMDAEYYAPEDPVADRNERTALRGEAKQGEEKVAAAQEEARQWQFLAGVHAAPEVVAAQKAVLEANERRKQERLNEEKRAQDERQRQEQMDADRRRRRAEVRGLAAQYQDFVEREAEREAAQQNVQGQAAAVLAEGFGAEPGANLPGAGARDVPESQTKTKKRPRPRPQADAIPDAAFDEMERSIRARERRMQQAERKGGEEKPREPERAPSPPPVGAAMAIEDEPPRQRDPLDFRKADYDKDDGLGPRIRKPKRKVNEDEAKMGRGEGGEQKPRRGPAERDQYDREPAGKRPGEGGASDRPTEVQRRMAEERERAATRPIEGGEDEERPAQRADRRHARGSEFHRPEAGKRGRDPPEAAAEPKRSRPAPQQAEQPQAPQPQEEKRRGRTTKHRKERTQRRHDPYGGRTRVQAPDPPKPNPPEEEEKKEDQPPAAPGRGSKAARQDRQDYGESAEASRARRHAKKNRNKERRGKRGEDRDPGDVRGADEPKEDPTEKKGEPEQKGEAKVPDPLAEAKAPEAPGGSRFRPGDHTKPAPRPPRKPGSQTMVEEPKKKKKGIQPVDTDDDDDDDDPLGYDKADGSHVKPRLPTRRRFRETDPVQPAIPGKQFLYVVVVYKVFKCRGLTKRPKRRPSSPRQRMT
jgi:hypothetical protein